jgi:hypothetical protein
LLVDDELCRIGRQPNNAGLAMTVQANKESQNHDGKGNFTPVAGQYKVESK